MPPEQVHQLVAGLERIAAAPLAHASIAAPIAGGLTGISAYLASDYVAADSMDSAVREFGPLAPADALAAAARLAGALDHAIAAGFTHGSLHPRDVLLSARETRMTGLGVGQLLAEIGIAPPVRRPYSAPERLAGSAWDRRADIFSLAALVHELLWGKRISGVGAQAVDGMTTLPGGDLDALKRVFKRALAEDPLERHPTAKIFVDALKRALPEVGADAVADDASAAPARNLRLATPPRPAPLVDEPLLPLETRFTEVDVVPDLAGPTAGPSILENADDPLDRPLEPRVGVDAVSDATPARGAQDDLELGWLARAPGSSETDPPLDLRTRPEPASEEPKAVPEPPPPPPEPAAPPPEAVLERPARPPSRMTRG